VQDTAEETAAAAETDDIAITPLAVPLLAGPGAISTVILLNGKARGIEQHAALVGCILIVCGIAYVVLRLSAHGAQWLKPIALKIATRLMGLLLAAIAFQFLINAIKEVKGTTLSL
jgi:multiple antibiotic resistance protein